MNVVVCRLHASFWFRFRYRMSNEKASIRIIVGKHLYIWRIPNREFYYIFSIFVYVTQTNTSFAFSLQWFHFHSFSLSPLWHTNTRVRSFSQIHKHTPAVWFDFDISVQAHQSMLLVYYSDTTQPVYSFVFVKLY